MVEVPFKENDAIPIPAFLKQYANNKLSIISISTTLEKPNVEISIVLLPVIVEFLPFAL